MYSQPTETLILEAYENGKKVAILDITSYSPEEFVEILDIQDMLGRECELKVKDETN